MGFATSTIKFAIFFFNFLLVIVGFGLVLYGVVDSPLPKELNSVNVYMQEVSLTTKVLIIGGAIMFAVAFFGCWGTVTDSPCSLFIYALLLIGLVVLEAIAVVYIYVHRDAVKEDATKVMQEWIKDYNRGNSTKHIIDEIQLHLKCCGVEKPEDWKNLADIDPPPASCCGKKTGESCEKAGEKVYTQGCFTKSWEKVVDTIKMHTWIVGAVVGVELLTILATLMVYNAIKNDQRRGGSVY